MVALEQWLDTRRFCRSLRRISDTFAYTYADAYADTNTDSDSNPKLGIAE